MRISCIPVQGGFPVRIEIGNAYPGATGGHLEFDLTFEALPNDDCDSSTPIASSPFAEDASTCAATTDQPEPSISCPYPNRTHSVWYAYTPPSGGRMDISATSPDYAPVLAVFKGSCSSLQEIACSDPGDPIVCLSVERDVPILIEVADASSPGTGGRLHLDVSFVPDLVLFWETDADVLKDRLVVGPVPAVIAQSLQASVHFTALPGKVPPTIRQNESIGYYESFNLTDGTNTLSMPDGVVLTTGILRRARAARADAITCANQLTDFQLTATNELDGSALIRGLYATPPNSQDAIELRLGFGIDAMIAGVRLHVILASEEFPEWAPHAPMPADKGQQQAFGCYPDTFGAFLDRDNFAFVKDDQSRNVLLNVAQQVIRLNNNISQGQDHAVGPKNCGSPLDPAKYRNVSYDVEYDGFSAQEIAPGVWQALACDAFVRGGTALHELQLVLSDVGPPETGDGFLDTAAFLSLEFLQCHCPPEDADGDRDVDLADFIEFQACYNGPNQPWSPPPAVQFACSCFDHDDDGDVDLTDFSNYFQPCYNGPNRPPACATQWCQELLENGGRAETGSLVVFDLSSPHADTAVRAGEPVVWSVSVRATGTNAGLAAYVFDVEIRRDADTGNLAKVWMRTPTLPAPLSDDSSIWRQRGPNLAAPGRIEGAGDAIAPPWGAPGGKATAGLSASVIATGSIDTADLTPGHYVLILHPCSASVLRQDWSAIRGGDNFAEHAEVAAGVARIGFDIRH